MRVVVNYRSNDADAEDVVASIRAAGGEAMAVRANVCDPSEVHRLVQVVTAQWGPVDVLVNTALVPYAMKSFQDMTWEDFGGKLHDEMLAAFTLTKAVVPPMIDRGYGRIIHVATNLARHPREKMIALGVSKAALVQFARYIAQELGPHGVTVNVVSPGPVDTQIGALRPPEVEEQITASTPLRRVAQPEDVAGVIAFYAGDASGFMTGTYAPVNGGLTMD
jgi:3-oxoacyl-[acyl-carrier protein] reductase